MARPGNLLQDLPFYQQPSAADAHVEADFEADADAGFDHGTGNSADGGGGGVFDGDVEHVVEALLHLL